jgi:hypothetical protein
LARFAKAHAIVLEVEEWAALGIEKPRLGKSSS